MVIFFPRSCLYKKFRGICSISVILRFCGLELAKKSKMLAASNLKLGEGEGGGYKAFTKG